MKQTKQLILKVLKNEARLWNEDKTELNQTKLLDTLDNFGNKENDLYENIISLLLQEKELKDEFFIKIKDVYVFKTNDFRFFMEENKIDNSYTAYKNRIGLSDSKKFLKDTNDVVLDFPYKDCVLEGGQSSEEGLDTFFEYSEKSEEYEEKKSKRKEIFFNQVLAHDEIDRLFDKKALVNWKRYTKDGEKEVGEIKRDGNGTIKENLIIKGNNLLALHSLKEQFAGKVKLIYIDPPYYFKETKSEDSFAYNSNFKLSTWLTFMKNRLDIAKELLTDDGFILVQIKEDGHSHLKLLMDYVFDGLIVNDIVVKMSESSGIKMSHVGKRLPNLKEYILFYKKNINSSLFPLKVNKGDSGDKLKEYLRYYKKVIVNPDDEVEKWNIVPIKDYLVKSGINPTEANVEDFQINNAERVVYRTNNASFGSLKIEKKLTKIISKKGLEYIWWEGKQMLFLSDYIDEYVCDLWTDLSTINLNKEGGVDFPNGKKPEQLLERIINLTTKQNDIVLDFHAGSGTTSCVSHKMKRQWITTEQIDSQVELALTRIKNVISGDQSGISKSVDWKGGGDFVYCELAKWNETAKKQISDCKSLDELNKLFDEMYDKYFLNYNLKIKEFKEKVSNEEEFKKLSLDDQKKLFIAMLDNNQMYVNETEMEDKRYGISDVDQKTTSKFYYDKQ